MFCVLGVVLQTILDVYNCFTCIVSLYRNDPTPRNWFFRRCIYIYIYLGTPVSSTNKTDRHDITEILLKVALNTIILIPIYIGLNQNEKKNKKKKQNK